MNNRTNPTAITPCIIDIIGQSDLSPPLNKRCTKGTRVSSITNSISYIERNRDRTLAIPQLFHSFKFKNQISTRVFMKGFDGSNWNFMRI